MKKVFSIFLLITFLFSSINLSVIRHFCGGKLAEVKLVMFNGNVSCGIDDENAGCNPARSRCNSNEGIGKKNCCENELTRISITDNYKPAVNSDLTNLQSLLIAFHSNHLFTHAQGHVTPVRNYKTPPDYNSVSLPFIQVFLV